MHDGKILTIDIVNPEQLLQKLECRSSARKYNNAACFLVDSMHDVNSGWSASLDMG